MRGMQTGFDRLCAHAVSADHRERRAALAALATEFSGAPASLDLISGALSTDPVWLVRQAAVYAVAAGWPAAPDTARLLHERASADGHPAVRAAARRALDGQDDGYAERWVRSTAAEADVDAVRERVEHGSVVDVWTLARHWRRSPDIGRFLHSCATTQASPAVREAALHALAAEWRTEVDVESLMRERAIADPEPQVRRAALGALARGWRDDPETPTLLRRLAVTDPDVRTAVLTILTREWKADPDTGNWLQELAREGDPDARVATLEVLAGSDGGAETHLLLQERAVADPDERVRQAALNILAARWHHDPQTRQFLHDNGFRPPRHSVVSRSGVPLDEVRQAAEWVALTIASGVLGNATYDAFKAGVQRLRHRDRTRAAAAASAEPAPASAEPAPAVPL